MTYNPEIGHCVQTGGCTGLVKSIYDGIVRVDGVYTYAPDEEDGELMKEYWSFEYLVDDLKNVVQWMVTKEDVAIWNYSNIRPVGY